jgi:hypothetical protein
MLGEFLKTQTREDAAEFLRVICKTDEQMTAVLRVMQSRGYKHSIHAIRNHRAATHPCPVCDAAVRAAKKGRQ